MDNSKIEWTDHTFNGWWGCMKVSLGCTNCYAEILDKRFQKLDGSHWGPNSSRKMMSESYWNKPLNWNRAAQRAGVKAKVFCASMADVFEDHPDLEEPRMRLFNLIDNTPNLIWQLLTKRPENILEMTPVWRKIGFPDNVWIGTSVENQKTAEERIPQLLKVPAKVRFLSCEPLIGPITFRWGLWKDYSVLESEFNLNGKTTPCHNEYDAIKGIHWVIAGGESGNRARPVHPDWIRSLRDQCQATNIPFFFKQWGEWQAFYDRDKEDPDWRNIPREKENRRVLNLEGGYGFHGERVVFIDKVGKVKSGRELDGKIHSQFPKP